MDFVITTFCNLNCKNCWVLIPYYKQPFHYDLEIIKTNLKKLSDCDKVKNIQLIGGETLLHPDINEIIRYISTLNFDIISIYTNCTVIPNNFEEALQVMDTRFILYLTNYPKSTKCEELIKLCDENNTQYEVNTFGNIIGSGEGHEWLKAGNPDVKPFPKNNPDTCGQIMTCMGDKIYRCARIGHLDQIIGLNLDKNEWCYIDEIDERYEELKEVKFTKNCNRCLRGTSMCVNIPKGS